MGLRAHSSAGSEHLPYKQGVGGSNPSAPTKPKRPCNSRGVLVSGGLSEVPYFYALIAFGDLPVGVSIVQSEE